MRNKCTGSTVIVALALWLAVQPASAGASDEIVSFPMTDVIGETTMLSARLFAPMVTAHFRQWCCFMAVPG